MTWGVKLRLLLALVVAGTGIGRAMLGETLEQSVARYGPPRKQAIASGSGTLFIFEGKDVSIGVIFFKGVAGLEEFFPKAGPELSDRAIASILEGEGAGGKWTKLPPSASLPALREWRREDGARAHYYGAASPPVGLALESKEFFDAEQAGRQGKK